ncbi:hypothetical protein B0H13DRAFT_2309183 [Mycena leptocephala]|nr:hypothetical protein B0H13DRAFT_2309183 [Mycena leptocephala]
MDPVLPHDLEHKIFRLAAVLDFSSIPTLMRVAWRVNAWVEPLLYRALHVASLTSQPASGMPHEVEFYRDLVRRPDFFRNAVHHLQLDQPAFRPSDPFGHLILATCTHLETLVLHELSGSSVATLLPRVQKLESLTHLHANFTDLLSKLSRQQRSAALGAFSRLTHLELRERTPSEDVCAELVHLPCLTHLALKYDSQARGTSSACARVLQTCAALRVLAALSEKRVIFTALSRSVTGSSIHPGCLIPTTRDSC